MKMLRALPLLTFVVGCGSFNPSAVVSSAASGSLKSIQEGKGISVEGIAKSAAEGAGVPTDAAGLAKAAGLPSVPNVPGLPTVPGVSGAPASNGGSPANAAAALLGGSGSKSDALGSLAVSAASAAMAPSKNTTSNAAAKAPPAPAAQPAPVAPAAPAPAPATAAAAANDAPAADADVPNANIRVAQMKLDDMRMKSVACRLAPGSDVGGLFGTAVIGAGFKEREARLNACSRRSTETRVTWVASGSKMTKVHATGSDAKTNACVERVLTGAVSLIDGNCGATVIHGGAR